MANWNYLPGIDIIIPFILYNDHDTLPVSLNLHKRLKELIQYTNKEKVK